MTRGVALGLLGAVLLAACAGMPAAEGEAEACPATATPRVFARVEPGRVVRRDVTMAEMREDADRVFQATAAGGLVVQNQPLRHYFGQSLTKTRLDARLSAEERTLADGRACAVPRRVDVVLRFVLREMRVASEARGDACLAHEVEAHEQRHVDLDDRMIEELRPIMEQRVREFAATLLPTTADNFEEAKARLTARLGSGVRAIYDELEVMRQRRHRDEIDTPAEYARVATMCEGRARALITGRS